MYGEVSGLASCLPGSSDHFPLPGCPPGQVIPLSRRLSEANLPWCGPYALGALEEVLRRARRTDVLAGSLNVPVPGEAPGGQGNHVHPRNPDQ